MRRFHGDQKKIQQYYDRRNDTSTTKYYLFGPDHRPLGGINRARRTIYETISRLRHQRNSAPRREPTGEEVVL